MLLVSRRETDETAMRVEQIVLLADGTTTRRPVPGARLRFGRARTHAHWHLEPFERYELRRAGGGIVARSREAGFCLGDRYRTPRAPTAAPPRAVWIGECGRGKPGLVSVREGISVGYGDDYPPFLEGQSIDVTGLAPGRYILVHRVNAGRALRESGHGNDAASVVLALDPGRARVRVLAHCADTATCGSEP